MVRLHKERLGKKNGVGVGKESYRIAQGLYHTFSSSVFSVFSFPKA
jgi:hypothetical protein